jgi:hypothetical protein
MRVQRFVVLVCVAAAACNWPTTVCGCTRPDVAYRVEGTVSLTSGAPVAGASLVASVAGASCAAVRPPVVFEPFGATTSASDGSFAITGKEYGDICVRVVARRPTVADSIVELIDLTPGRRTQSVSMRFP